jgi:glycosyltransferase involved in cell wall biosynthesis
MSDSRREAQIGSRFSVLSDRITPLIITFNEAENLSRTLNKLKWARRIIVIDSGSTDATLDIVAQYPQAETFHRAFTTFAEQCNFGLTQIGTDWVLSLDADYELSDELVREVHDLEEKNEIGGYQASFIYRIYGRQLRGTLYPPRIVLYRINGARYTEEGHGHRVSIPGSVVALRAPIFHDDRKPLVRWFRSQQRYADVEANYLLNTDSKDLSHVDRIRRAAWPAPILVVFYVLVVKGCLLDGWAGWFYAIQRCVAEMMLALELVDRQLRRDMDSRHTR